MTDLPISVHHGFVSPEEATATFSRLWSDLDWEERPDAPRREYWTNTFDRSYTYGRGRGIRAYDSRPISSDIEAVRDRLATEHGVFFEGCFLNGYRNGSDALGFHADDDPGIDHDRPIAIVTLYDGPVVPSNWNKLARHPNHGNPVSRTIQFMAQDDPDKVVTTVDLDHGSLIFMKAGMQSTHFHRIPKAGYKVRPRISLTFRGLLP